MKKDPNVIQITELQKLAQMDVTDKYAVLEFLVKELMGMRKEDQMRQGPLFRTAEMQYEYDDRGFSPTSMQNRRGRAQTFDEKAGTPNMKQLGAGKQHSVRDEDDHPLTNQVN